MEGGGAEEATELDDGEGADGGNEISKDLVSGAPAARAGGRGE